MEGEQNKQDNSKDIILGRKILIALSQRKSTSVPFPNLLDLHRKAYAIHGEPNSGKSLLAQDSCISVLMRGRDVVYVDSDYRFNVLGLLDRIKDVCKSRNLPSTHFKSACRNMIVQKCGTSTELQSFLSFKLRELVRTSDVGLVVVDSLTSFFWHDRYARSGWKAFYDSLWSDLEALRLEYGFTSMVTIQNLYSEQKTPHNFLHCPKVPVESIRIRKHLENKFQLVLESNEKIECEMHDGTLVRTDRLTSTSS
ncbi:uncharacterized protein LOC100902392 [Galendromus occidentalis]|uniref:Uncharacterized protein LOC100902392 n=1 Tax=Galendromus occidentalis TaxID=34638 RepID=A0AAJ6QPC8_9ACAR|nr:uncharacterized protein LOC100902392 [Galendromus occidentalis]